MPADLGTLANKRPIDMTSPDAMHPAVKNAQTNTGIDELGAS